MDAMSEDRPRAGWPPTERCGGPAPRRTRSGHRHGGRASRRASASFETHEFCGGGAFPRPPKALGEQRLILAGSAVNHLLHQPPLVNRRSSVVSDTGGNGAGSLPSCPTSIPGALAAAEKISPEISIPCGFPQSGEYRIVLEIKRHGQIETATFDTDVQFERDPAGSVHLAPW